MAQLTSLSRSIAGRVAIVTGAASGMGRATAHLFADEGAKVAVIDRDADGALAVADEIVGAHGEGSAKAWALDVAIPADITRVVDEVVAALGPIDILVNNAGVALLAVADGDGDAYEDSWTDTLAINLS